MEYIGIAIIFIFSVIIAYRIGSKPRIAQDLEILEKNKSLTDELIDLEKNISLRQKEIQNISNEKIILLEDFNNKKSNIDYQLKDYCLQIENEKSNKIKQMQQELENSFIERQSEYNLKEKELENSLIELNCKLDSLKAKRKALNEAFTREEKIREQQEFFKIKISEEDLSDIQILEKIKPNLRKPEVLSKVIWTTYIQKPTSTLINNVVGDQGVCGIYKITNTLNNKSYIGQSVNIPERFKQHIKAGLGIDGSNNKLYSSMKKDGVWNFTFEILEICNRTELNEREKFYIETYESNKYGLNVTLGGS